MKPEDLDAVATSFASRRRELSAANQNALANVQPVTVEFDFATTVRDVVSIDSSYVVLFKDPSYPLWVVATRAAMIHRRYDPEGPRYTILANDYTDDLEALDGTNPAVVETDDFIEILPDRDGKINELSIEERIRHMASRAEEEAAMKAAREHEGIMILFDGSLVSSNKTIMNIVRACEDNGNVIVGISKDSNLRRINSIALDEHILSEYSASNPDFTGHVVIDEDWNGGIGTCFARLHPRALKWFRVDYMINTEQMTLAEMLQTIACYSQVNTQPGNPFPPLVAHDVAVKIRQYKTFIEEYLMKALRREGMTPREIISGLTTINGKPITGSFHDYLDQFTRVRGTR